MITITTTNGYKFKFKGRMILYTSDFGTMIAYSWSDQYGNVNGHDLFWKEDIVSIIGSDDEQDRDTPEVDLFSK